LRRSVRLPVDRAQGEHRAAQPQSGPAGAIVATRTLADIEPGDAYAEAITLTAERVAQFIGLTRDRAGVHVDEGFSRQIGFDGNVVHGFLLCAYFSRILGMELPGENAVIGSVKLEFHEPVYVGETVEYRAEVRRVLRPLGSVHLDLRIEGPGGKRAVLGTATCAFRA
jgi:acyl dehydratase